MAYVREDNLSEFVLYWKSNGFNLTSITTHRNLW